MVQHGGTALSYLNLFDADAAWRLVHELASGAAAAAVAIIKHANPCGAAVAGTLAEAYAKALECDPVSAFGGVVALGGPCTAAVAREVAAGPQADVIVAPACEAEALEIMVARRKATRLLEAPPYAGAALEVRSLGGGYLVQDADRSMTTRSDWQVATEGGTHRPNSGATSSWPGGCAPGRHSNAIVIVAAGQAVGIGAGQQSRVEAAEIAVRKAGSRAKAAAAASDAFFPFRDGLDVLAEAGVAVVIQPGGSVRDAEVIAAADEHGTAMVLTSRAALPALSGGVMAANILNGETVAARIRAEVADAVKPSCTGPVSDPGLGTILVGDDAPSARYVAMKHEDCSEVGIVSVHEHLPADVGQDELEAVIARFNADPTVHAYLVQVPLPAGLDEERALLAVDPAKDVDGLHPVNLGRLVMGDCPARCPAPRPASSSCWPPTTSPVEGRHVVIIGRGLTIGRPLALLLALKRPGCNAAVTVVHTGVADLAALVRTGPTSWWRRPARRGS